MKVPLVWNSFIISGVTVYLKTPCYVLYVYIYTKPVSLHRETFNLNFPLHLTLAVVDCWHLVKPAVSVRRA